MLYYFFHVTLVHLLHGLGEIYRERQYSGVRFVVWYGLNFTGLYIVSEPFLNAPISYMEDEVPTLLR